MKPIRIAPRWLVTTAAIFGLTLLILGWQHRHQTEKSESENLVAERGRLQRTLELAQQQGRQLDQEFDRAVEKADEPPLDPAERRKRELAAKLVEYRATESAKRALRPIHPEGPRGEIFPELMNDPDYVRNVEDMWRPIVETRYAPWFKTLTVTPDVRASIEKLLLGQISADYAATTVRSGDPKKDREEMIRRNMKIQEALSSDLKKQLGEAGYSDFITYGNTIRTRETLVGVTRRLSYSEEPLTARQIDQIVSLLPRSEANVKADVRLAPARAVFSPKQWEQVEEYARDGGSINR